MIKQLRPVTSVGNERIFNILRSRFNFLFLNKINILDLYAGLGNFGKLANKYLRINNLVFVEKNRNLSCKLKKKFGNAIVLCCKAEKFLIKKIRFNLIFLDPPYVKISEPYLVLLHLMKKEMLFDDSVIVFRKSVDSLIDIDYKISYFLWRDDRNAIIFILSKYLYNFDKEYDIKKL